MMQVLTLYIIRQRLPVLLELLRFFPPLTYTGQSWEVSANNKKTLFKVSTVKGLTMLVHQIEMYQKKRPLEKRLLPLSDISYYYVQRKGFATSTYCVTSYIHWSLAKPKPAKLSSKPSCFLFFFFLPNCIMAKNAKVLKMETLC